MQTSSAPVPMWKLARLEKKPNRKLIRAMEERKNKSWKENRNHHQYKTA